MLLPSPLARAIFSSSLTKIILIATLTTFIRAAEPSQPLTEKLARIPPKTATEEAQTFRVLDGFRMDLLAAEPLVASPVAMTYDEDGRAYVCEMRDYPYTDKAHHKPSQENPTDSPIGRIRLMEDTDGDGKFDKATMFADGLSWPTGVACWKGGVFVAATPDIWYLKDTDGDGKADVRTKVFTGFRKLNVQAVMNNLVWGLDNHIHGAGGSNGGQIRPGDKPDAKPLVMTRSDFRFDPVTDQLELLAGGARFGGTFDDWGNRFLCNIRNPAQHIVLPAHYLARNPFLAARSPLNDMAESGDQLPVFPISQPEPWRVLRAKRWAGERDIVMPRSELVGAGVVTSASGITSYRGAAYPEKYRGNVFVCECAGNLLYRLQLTPDGPTFKAARVDGKAEMVASTDNWFRPVNFVNAPDGTLHVLDMYRENIEHPWSIPEDIHAAVDLEAGRDMGRIWRLTPPDFKPGKPPRLGSASTAELVATLENPNSWWRETAQRLLFERQDKTAAPPLRKLLRESASPLARLHALWTLDGLHELHDEDLVAAFESTAAPLKEHALRLAEPRLKNSEALRELVLAAARSADERVRMQAAFTLGECPDPRAPDALAHIALTDDNNLWTRAAVLSSVGDRSDQLLAKLLQSAPSAAGVIGELAQIIGTRGKPDEIQRVLSFVKSGVAASATFRAVASGIADGLKRSGKNLRRLRLDPDPTKQIATLLDQAKQEAGSEKTPLPERLAAIRFLAYDDFLSVKDVLSRLLDPRQPQDIQRAAVGTIGSFAEPDTAAILLANWRAQTPAIRSEIVLAMLDGRSRALPLLQAIEKRDIPASQVPFARRAALLRSTNPQIRDLATSLFGGSAAGSRKDVVARYQPALSLKGDADRGRKIFETACAICHRAGDLGKDVGPNLATIRQWNADQILINILDPNREVAPNFITYSIETTGGRTLDGILADENAGGITVQRADGVTDTILRSEITKLTSAGLSMMPEGLEVLVSIEQMADLIAFLQRPPP